MSGIKDQHNLDDLRDRLYARGKAEELLERHELRTEASEVRTDWNTEAETKKSPKPVSDIKTDPVAETPPTPDIFPNVPTVIEEGKEASAPKKKRSYRLYVLLGAFGILLGAIVFSSIYLLMGGNQISPSNVEISVAGPFSVGGGEILPIEIEVANQNTAPIQSATLIVNYPPGTKTVGDNPRDLFEERLPVEDVAPGETITVPVRAVVFGEESQELTLTATVEYRLEGSNGTFFKDAEPLVFQITSSPVIVTIDAIERVSSGQETDITLTVKSNSPSQLQDILVVADYPTGFDYTSATPAPSFGQNTWLIETIDPDSSAEIVLRGIVIGQEDDEFEMRFNAGTPSESNRFSMGSVLTTASNGFIIERPFIDVKLSISGDDDGTAILSPGQTPGFDISVTNTLNDAVFDMFVVASLGGTAFSENDIEVNGGFYDSLQNEVRWNTGAIEGLDEVLPGTSRRFNFSIKPGATANTPEIEVDVDVFARRVSENRVDEELIGTTKGAAKISTEVTLGSDVRRSTSDTGPIPPVAETETEYTITLKAENGTNDITGAVVTFSLPPYVLWDDDYDGNGSIIYNPVSKEVTWDIGNIEANQEANIIMGVTLLPSTSQVDQKPTLITTQRLRATDRFTGVVVRAETTAKSTELSREFGFPTDNGKVQLSE